MPSGSLWPGTTVTVYTTCARDYITWKNEYPEGETLLNGVVIRRFPVAKTRDIGSFNEFSDWIFHNPHSPDDEREWMERQGPYSTGLVEALSREEGSHDLFIFFTYLYYNTYWGLKAVPPEKAVLVPTAHDEPALRPRDDEGGFRDARGLSSSTRNPSGRCSAAIFPSRANTGTSSASGSTSRRRPSTASSSRNTASGLPYILYAGRIEPGKGCRELLDNFLRHARRSPGPRPPARREPPDEAPDQPAVRYLGFVTPENKNAAMAGALATIHPSHFESLCMAALESLAVRTPILVQEATDPLKRHCLEGQCGLYYSTPEEFGEALALLEADERLRRVLGGNGFDYVARNYAWPRSSRNMKRLFEHVLGPGPTGRGPELTWGSIC